MNDGPTVAAVARRGLWSDARRRLRGNRAASAALIVLAAIALVALIAPALSPWSYDSLDWQHLAQPPGSAAAHWLGTDRLGRDLLVRTLHGVRLSLLLAVLASAVSLVIGVLWGAVAGLAGGRIDGAMMRFVDVLYSLPYLFVVIILTTLFTRGSLIVPQMILFESFLSFLGLGVQEPQASLGNLIFAGAQEMESAPWMLLVPATALVLLLLALNLLGDALRDAFDPREH